MLSFRVTIHPCPAASTPGPRIALAGHEYQTLSLARVDLAAALFECTFETALAALEQLEQMFIEPDGSFVWTSPPGTPTWQVDGNLYDRAARLAFVDASGSCPVAEFDRLITALGWPGPQLAFQLTHEAVVLDETEFRRYAARQT